MMLSIMTPTPRGAALYKLVEIKPADDPNLVPYENLGALVFWYDPNPYGDAGPVIRKVHPEPSPISLGEVVMSLIQRTQPPAPEVQGHSLDHRLNLIHRIENHRIDALKRAHSGETGKGEDAIKTRGLLTEVQRADLLHGDFALIGSVLQAAWMPDFVPEASAQDHRSDSE